jgi:hypothetical protein
MAQNNIYLDEKEENKVKKLQEEWKINSKQETIKKIIRDFQEVKK